MDGPRTVTSLDSVRCGGPAEDAATADGTLTVALVGSRCWVAAALTRALTAAGDRVVLLDLDDPDVSGGARADGSGVDVVLHLAAGPQEATLRGQSEPALQTLAALHAARTGSARLVIASLPGNAAHLPADEALAAGFRSAHDVETVVVRVAECYGPGMPSGRPGVVGRMLGQAQRGEVVVDAGDDTEHRVCFVDDVVTGLVAAVHDPSSGPFLVGPTQGVRSRDLALAVAGATGAAHRVRERRRLRVAGPTDRASADLHPAARLPADDSSVEPLLPGGRGVPPRGWAPTVDLPDGLDRCVAALALTTLGGESVPGVVDLRGTVVVGDDVA